MSPCFDSKSVSPGTAAYVERVSRVAVRAGWKRLLYGEGEWDVRPDQLRAMLLESDTLLVDTHRRAGPPQAARDCFLSRQGRGTCGRIFVHIDLISILFVDIIYLLLFIDLWRGTWKASTTVTATVAVTLANTQTGRFTPV